MPNAPHQRKNPHKALMHPLRRNLLLGIAHEGVSSPNRLARMLGSDINTVAYHIRVLADYEAIVLKETKPRRGAREHFYELNSKSEVISVLMKEQIAKGDEDGFPGLSRRLAIEKENKVDIVTLNPMELDRTGVQEVQIALDEVAAKLGDVQKTSSARLAEGSNQVVPTFLTIGVVAFPWNLGNDRKDDEDDVQAKKN